MRTRTTVVMGLTAAALAPVLAGCGSGSNDETSTVVRHAGELPATTETTPATTVQTTPAAAEGCTPVVMVIRHAEDGPNPAGGADILNASGEQHAALYPKLFARYVSEPHGVGVAGAKATPCEIGKIIAIDRSSNDANKSPGTNPYKTIEPTANSLGLPIKTNDGKTPEDRGVSYSTVYDWDEARLKTVLDNGTPTPTSTVIAWDKQGLYPSAEDLAEKRINNVKLGDYGFTPLLEAFPADKNAIVGGVPNYTPQRTDFFVFAQQDPATGKFAIAKAYKQQFSDDGGSTWYQTDRLSDSNDPDDIKV